MLIKIEVQKYKFIW